MATASTIPFAFDITRYVDFDYGNDTTGDGLTLATAWKTLAKFKASVYTGVAIGTTVSALCVVAGVSGGTYGASSSNGYDQLYIDAFTDGRVAGISGGNGYTHIGVRAAIYEIDGPRASSNTYVRPQLRCHTVFGSLTQYAATSTYYVDLSAIMPANTYVGGVFFKAAQAGGYYNTVTNSVFDGDGCAKIHLLLQYGTDTEANINTAISAGVCRAYYQTTTKKLYVNTTNLNTTAADFSWAPSTGLASMSPTKGIEAWSKIVLIGCDTAAVEGVDTMWGERGVVIFDARRAYVKDVHSFEPYVHGVIFSYSNWALQNIVCEDCKVFGLGKSSTGDTMFAATGQSGNFDSSGVVFRRCESVRYMLQNPAGARYTAADYRIISFAAGTAASAGCGYLLPSGAVFEDCVHRDLSATKTYDTRAEFWAIARGTIPTDRSNPNTYPMIFRRLTAYIHGGMYTVSSSADQLGNCVAFDDCNIYQVANGYRMAVDRSKRTANVYHTPNGTYWYHGLFGTEWIVVVTAISNSGTGASEAGQTYCGFGWYTDGGTTGNTIKWTAVDSTVLVVPTSNNNHYVYDQNSDNDVADKVFDILSRRGTVGIARLRGYPNNDGVLNYGVVFQDLPAASNTARVFSGTTLVGVNTPSSANTTHANWVTNVDPYAKVGTEFTANMSGTFPAGNVVQAIRGRSGR